MSSSRPPDLPDFAKPPVAEVVLSLQFSSLSSLTTAHVGLLWRRFRDRLPLIESTGISEPLPVAATFALSDELGAQLGELARLDTMVTVVDGPRFLRDFGSGEDLLDRGLGVDVEDDRSIAELLVDQVELANVLVLNKTDKMSEKEVARLTGILRKLNQTATFAQATYGRIPLDLIFDTGLFDFEAVGSPRWTRQRSPTTRRPWNGSAGYGSPTTATRRARLAESAPFYSADSWLVAPRSFSHSRLHPYGLMRYTRFSA